MLQLLYFYLEKDEKILRFSGIAQAMSNAGQAARLAQIVIGTFVSGLLLWYNQ